MKPLRPFLAAGVSALAVLAASGCSARGYAQSSGRDLYLFLDLSASVTQAQRTLWKNESAHLTNSLGDDSSIAIYAIHDHTMDAARLFEAEIPVPAGDGTRTAAEKQKAARTLARKGALAAIAAALDSGGKAPRTDIFSAIDRVHAAPGGRRVQIYFFSDMLNSTPDFNMEVPSTLTHSTIQNHISQLVRRHSWRSGQLAGTEIYCLLNSVDSGGRGPAVDRLTQQAFYQALFESLGARLMVYDTNVFALTPQASEGDRYVAQVR